MSTQSWGHARYDRNAIRSAMTLYGVTDRRFLVERSLPFYVQAAIEGGTTFIQLREKDAPESEIIALAQEILPLCREHGIPFVIDDDVEIAYAVQADGVHVGQSDESCRAARERLGDNAIIGVSAATVEQALAAQEDGADYLGIGAMFSTATKTDADLVSYETLKEIVNAVSIPVVAIGGLNAETIPRLAGSGIDGVAVVSAIFAARDPFEAARRLRDAIEELEAHA